MQIGLVAAVARNGVIGRDRQLPWRLPDDLKRFKHLTKDHAVIMGRITYESIGRPLPDRQNIVISSRPDFAPPGCTTAPSLAAALSLVTRRDECFVIGGAGVYRDALPLADRLYLTILDDDVAGDTRFPDYDASQFREISREPHAADAKHAHAFAFVTLERVAKTP